MCESSDTDARQLVKFFHPACHYVAGSSQAGKTFNIIRLLERSDRYFKPAGFTVILSFIGSDDALWFSFARRDSRVKLYRNLPDISDLKSLINSYDKKEQVCLIFDDMIIELLNSNDRDFVSLFSKISHHSAVSVIMISQFLYCSLTNGSMLRAMQSNSQYLHIFQNRRFISSISVLSHQIVGKGLSAAFLKMYQKSTQDLGGFLIIALHPRHPQSLMFIQGQSLLSDSKKLKIYQLKR